MHNAFNNNKNTLYELTRKQVKTQYRDSTLGFLWTILNPLLNMLVMWLVFKNVLGIKDPYYPIYLLAGNILFSTLRFSTMQSLESMVKNRGLLLRTKIDLEVFPLSNVFTSVVNFAFSLLALIPFMIWLTFQYGVNLFTFRLVFILLMIPAFILFEYGLGLFLSALYVFFRDLKHIYTVFMLLWQYLTPIFYTIDKIDPDNIALKFIQLNPMFHFLNYFRDAVYRGATGIDVLGVEIGPYIPVWSTLGVIYACGIGAFVFGYVFFRLLKSKIVVKI